MHDEYSMPNIKPATTNLSRFQVVKGNRGSQRAELIEKFLERVTATRQANGFRAISPARMGKMLAHIPTDQLYPFYRDCERARSFTAYFHWSLKPDGNGRQKGANRTRDSR